MLLFARHHYPSSHLIKPLMTDGTRVVLFIAVRLHMTRQRRGVHDTPLTHVTLVRLAGLGAVHQQVPLLTLYTGKRLPALRAFVWLG